MTGWKEKGVKWEGTKGDDEGIWSKYVTYVHDNVITNPPYIINTQT